jgi:molybdate transport system permease protein
LRSASRDSTFREDAGGRVRLPLSCRRSWSGCTAVLFGSGTIGSLLDEWFGIVFAFMDRAALASALMGFSHGPESDCRSVIDRRSEVARLGGSRAWFASITPPLALPGTTASLSFARGLGESARPSPSCDIPATRRRRLRSTFTQVPGGDAQALRLSIIAVILSILALVTSEWLTRRAARAQSDDRR